jgi:hypothetical protein
MLNGTNKACRHSAKLVLSACSIEFRGSVSLCNTICVRGTVRHIESWCALDVNFGPIKDLATTHMAALEAHSHPKQSYLHTRRGM